MALAQLRENVADMGADRRLGDEEPVTTLLRRGLNPRVP